ncbi:hypothetical protein GIB67_036217 [Kingdonia uniflora]|uniref:Aminotransferase-like plant mobile domain-containing protein n=1 Tax=Kingdonia uniflora TaxID=39325 RepID=A0A7J7NXA5_9MAGN|nr:hypothetical protein GIB67_036217 [Kingdonia uniflora]
MVQAEGVEPSTMVRDANVENEVTMLNAGENSPTATAVSTQEENRNGGDHSSTRLSWSVVIGGLGLSMAITFAEMLEVDVAVDLEHHLLKGSGFQEENILLDSAMESGLKIEQEPPDCMPARVPKPSGTACRGLGAVCQFFQYNIVIQLQFLYVDLCARSKVGLCDGLLLEQTVCLLGPTERRCHQRGYQLWLRAPIPGEHEENGADGSYPEESRKFDPNTDILFFSKSKWRSPLKRNNDLHPSADTKYDSVCIPKLESSKEDMWSTLQIHVLKKRPHDREDDITNACAFILFMMGHLWFQMANDTVPLRYLAAAADLDSAAQYDRGSAIFTSLYHGLDTTVVTRGAIAGFIQLLLYWFYEYCGVGHPIVKEVDKFLAYLRLRAWERGNKRKTNDYATNMFILGEERETYASYWAEQTSEVGHMLTDSQRMGNIDLFGPTALKAGITPMVVTSASVHSLSQDFSLPGKAEGPDSGWHMKWTGRREMLPITRLRDLPPMSSSYGVEKL